MHYCKNCIDMYKHILLLILSLSNFLVLLSFAAASGGSNYAWYQVDGVACNRESYGVIANYDAASTVIKQQLATMYKNGQRRLRIPIYFGHDLNSGTIMNSTGGDLSARYRKNLKDFLAEVKNTDFVEVEVGFFPQGSYSDPTQWTTYKETCYQENWMLIKNLHPIIDAAGILYRIDLMNEGAPTSTQPILLQYVQHLWNDYVSTFGKINTVGFSIISDVTQDRFQVLPQIYGDSQYGNHGAPYLFDIHIYNAPKSSPNNAYSGFINAFKQMQNTYPSSGWIVGEASYNDASQAESFSKAINETRQTVFYITQWPVTTESLIYGSSPNCRGVNVVPLKFDNYKVHGF